MVLGLRVVRGPDWGLGNEDGGDGHLGTVVKDHGNNTVTVVWDMGTMTTCSAGKDGKCDLRILDNAPTGIRFGSATCSECKVNGIFGMKWNCMQCDGLCLCSVCYIKGKHNEKHVFLRYFCPGSDGVKVPKRFTSNKQRSLGIFPGAKVVRGMDWRWSDQDGGAGKPGTVAGLRSYEEGLGDRNSVAVTWEKTQKTYKYRLGFEGKVDLKCKVDEEAPGYDYYKEHLPVLDADILAMYAELSSDVLKVNDSVCVGVSKEDLKVLQENHGGWTVRMEELPGRMGKIDKFTRSGDALVSFGAEKWIVNPDTLVKVHDVDIDDIVTVVDDQEFVKLAQEDHGGWVDDMAILLGKAGKVVRITPKEDVVVAFGKKTWVFSPACLTPSPDEEIFEVNPRTDGTFQSAAGYGNVLGLLLAQMLLDGAGVRVVGPEEFIQAAARGDEDLIGKILRSKPQLVNQVIKDTTALVLASHEGHDEVVKTLLRNKANTEQTDAGGNTPLLAAVVGKKVSTTKILLDAGANIDFANRQHRTALHIASKAGEDLLVKLLIVRECDVNPQDIAGNTPIHDAIYGSHDDVIALLLGQTKLDFCKKNRRGMNVLHLAAIKNNGLAVDEIVGRHKDLVDVKKEDGVTALHLAAYNNHTQVASVLLIKGSATIDIQTNDGDTPLHLAAMQCHYLMVKLLLDNEASTTLQDNKGNTPLHVVLGSSVSHQTLLQVLMVGPRGSDVERIKIGCLLVQFGAKIDVKNKSGKTPIDVCQDQTVRRAIVKCAEQTKPAANARSRPTSAAGERKVFSRMKMNCVECSDNPAQITYEPCKHKLHCLQCTFEFDECPVCYGDIEKRKDQDGNVIICSPNPCRMQ
ncbi:E3 ubiquitin-protein ligase MIB2-like [Ylistrum balloti]|uniref:E3 ubiquitin-protein ligase MIB2-like n=1 Tax=Ylistrum balloti TaxID=509963 RepID=UPI0029057D87|nr:E3 ubiquitin-protein ligase MIB2-like [Ylistrum balloti]